MFRMSPGPSDLFPINTNIPYQSAMTDFIRSGCLGLSPPNARYIDHSRACLTASTPFPGAVSRDAPLR
uniref:Uncharacterized protein n=1 Tax=Caenorhabditis japonica TaxID=281687 RepID=A0A8R1EKA8_CAEJA